MSFRHTLVQTALDAAGLLSALGAPRRRPKPAEILILTAYTAEIAGYGDLAAANRRAYAQRHGYAFLARTDGFVPDRPAAWSKIRFIQEALRSYRWVFWTDADSLIMNGEIALESLLPPAGDLHLSRANWPFAHINTGQMFFRSSLLSRVVLGLVWRMTAFIHDSSWEQRALNHLLEHYRVPRTTISPNRRFNSYGPQTGDPECYRDGDFIIHFPGVPGKEALMRTYAHEARVA